MHPKQFGKRLAALVPRLGDLAGAAKSAHVSVSTFKRYLRGEGAPGMLDMAVLAALAGVRLQWLVTGTEPMDGDTPVAPQPKPVGSDLVMVPRYDIQASAGSGRLPDREHAVEYLPFSAAWLRRAIGDPANLVLITAVGHSMEPAIRSGDLLMVDTSMRAIEEAVYVIINQDLLVVKRLQPLVSGGVSVRSDNVAEFSEERLSEADAERLIVVGRVRWIGRLI